MLEPSEKHKALTRFLCQELLYEFVIGKLDLDKQKVMDDYLSTDRESQHELERLRRGFVFASQMSKTQMSREMRAALLGFEPMWKRRLAATTAWWSRRGWKILPYFVLAGVVILATLIAKPWVYLQQHDVVLVEEAKQAPPPANTPNDAKVQSNGENTPLKPEEKAASAAKPAVPDMLPPVIPAEKKKEKKEMISTEAEPEYVPSPAAVPKPSAMETAPVHETVPENVEPGEESGATLDAPDTPAKEH